MDALLPAIAGPAFDRLRHVLVRLGEAPPQVLLLEGGTETQRMDVARYWAARINCPQAVTGTPCLQCPTCRQIAAGEYLDWAAYDGRISNREDEENPGPVRALNMENVRALKVRLRDTTHGGGRRVVVLAGLRLTRDEAANALLKVLEEPSSTTVFILLTPQREQLLPTLISRSFCLTLPWPDSRQENAQLQEWPDLLARFLQTGKGFLDKSSARGAVDADLASRLLLCCQKAMIRVLAGDHTNDRSLDAAFMSLDARGRAVACRWFTEAQEALQYGVTPARVLEALAMQLFVLRRETR